MRTRSVAWMMFGVWLAACGGGQSSSGGSASPQPAGGEQQHGTAESTSNMPEDSGAASDASSAQSAAPSSAPAEAVQVVAGTITPIPEGTHPRVEITAPRANTVLHTNRVEVHLHVTDWPAPQEGRHIHLILDNEPYRRIDDPSRPVALENLTQGEHVLRAFPGWHTHESVKTPGAFAMVVFYVGTHDDTLHFDPHAPLLTYSRPKGDYYGAQAEHILLDFYISNVPNNALSATGFRVRYAIDGSTTGEITSWVPNYIDHLPDGAHTLVLDLLGADGQLAPGPFNHTERTIHVDRASSAPDEHAHAASAAPAAEASPAPAQHGHAAAHHH